MDIETIKTLENCLFRAWPALETRYYDGWLLRFSNGYTRRANSVNILGESSLELAEKIIYCEGLYTERHLNTVFRLNTANSANSIEALLEKNGYAYDAPTAVACRSLEDFSSTIGGRAKIETRLTPGWAADFIRLSKVPAAFHSTLKQMLGLIYRPCCFVRLVEEGQVIAVGLGVLDGEQIGLYDLVVGEEARRRGFGREMTTTLMQWGKDHGARYAYLQVMLDNLPALTLYQNLGFTEAYQYWYRGKSSPK